MPPFFVFYFTICVACINSQGNNVAWNETIAHQKIVTISENHADQYCEHEYSIQPFFERLLNDYDKHLLPNKNGNTVQLEVHVQEISEVSESRSDFTVDLFVSEIWYDHRLTFDFLDVCRSNITIKTEFKNKIWTPDTCVINSKQAVLHKSPSENAFFIVYSDGRIWQNHRMQIRGPCEIDLRAFPFDTQRCSVSFETNSYNFQEVELKWFPHPVTLLWHGHLPDFHLMSTFVEKLRIEYPNGLWDELQLTFVFKRKVGYYLFQAYFPTALTVVVSWLTFYLESKALSARVTLSVSALLALTFQFGNVLNHLPRVSYVKFIDVWMIGCCIFVFASMVEMAATCQCTRRQMKLREGKRAAPIDNRWVEMKMIGKRDLQGEGAPLKSAPVVGKQRFWGTLKGSLPRGKKVDILGPNGRVEEEQLMAIHNKVTDEVIIMGVDKHKSDQMTGSKSKSFVKSHNSKPVGSRGSVTMQYMPSMDLALKRNICFDGEPAALLDASKDVGIAGYVARHLREWVNAWSKYRLTADRLDRISRVMFPTGFFLFNFFYWTAYYFSLQ